MRLNGRTGLSGLLVLPVLATAAVAGEEAKYPTAAFDGRILTDAGVSSDGDKTINGSEIRLLWLGAKGKVSKDLSYRVLLGFEGNKTSIKDAVITYGGIENVKVMVGNFKAFTGIENMSANLHTTFLERSNGIKPFRPIRRMGLGVTYEMPRMSFAGGVFGGDLNDAGGKDQPWSLSGRITGAPVLSEDGSRVVHLGVSTFRDHMAADVQTLKFSAAGETHVINEKLVSTGTIANVETSNTVAGEAMVVYGPFTFMSEVTQTTVGRDSMPDLEFTGGYANVGYFLTGEHRPYKVSNGTYGRLKPNNPVSEGGKGAFEVAARYSAIDLTDDHITAGGKLNSTTLAFNWYPEKNIRVMANHVLNETSEGSTVPDYEPQYSMVRVQVDF